MTPKASPPVDTKATGDDRLNEKFQTLLREAADQREVRARTLSAEESAAARQESADLLGLARDPNRASRP